MSKKNQNNDLNKVMKEHLPKNINLHSMQCIAFEYLSDPSYMRTIDDIKLLHLEKRSLTFTLKDEDKDIDLVITVNKTINHL